MAKLRLRVGEVNMATYSSQSLAALFFDTGAVIRILLELRRGRTADADSLGVRQLLDYLEETYPVLASHKTIVDSVPIGLRDEVYSASILALIALADSFPVTEVKKEDSARFDIKLASLVRNLRPLSSRIPTMEFQTNSSWIKSIQGFSGDLYIDFLLDVVRSSTIDAKVFCSAILTAGARSVENVLYAKGAFEEPSNQLIQRILAALNSVEIKINKATINRENLDKALLDMCASVAKSVPELNLPSLEKMSAIVGIVSRASAASMIADAALTPRPTSDELKKKIVKFLSSGTGSEAISRQLSSLIPEVRDWTVSWRFQSSLFESPNFGPFGLKIIAGERRGGGEITVEGISAHSVEEAKEIAKNRINSAIDLTKFFDSSPIEFELIDAQRVQNITSGTTHEYFSRRFKPFLDVQDGKLDRFLSYASGYISDRRPICERFFRALKYYNAARSRDIDEIQLTLYVDALRILSYFPNEAHESGAILFVAAVQSLDSLLDSKEAIRHAVNEARRTILWIAEVKETLASHGAQLTARHFRTITDASVRAEEITRFCLIEIVQCMPNHKITDISELVEIIEAEFALIIQAADSVDSST